MLAHFKIIEKKQILKLTKTRRFETKLGEMVCCASTENIEFEKTIKESKAKYVIVGIPEDIGVKANYGVGGATTAWPSFLKSFLNIQSNDFLSGEEIMLAGYFDFSEVQKIINVTAANEEEKVAAYRAFVAQIDDQVEEVVKIISRNNKIPIIIGGGHNNAYPAIKGAAKGLYSSGKIPLAQISCVNMDAHTDYRPAEGRHSGNGFRYAEDTGYLHKYYILGLHENYLQQNVWIDMVNNPFIDCTTFEDIFIHQKLNFQQALAHGFAFTSENFIGIELDLDAVQNTLSSAMAPCGFTPLQARQFVHIAAMGAKVAYLHICEGATALDNGLKDESTGKLISYLVTDFIKAYAISNAAITEKAQEELSAKN